MVEITAQSLGRAGDASAAPQDAPPQPQPPLPTDLPPSTGLSEAADLPAPPIASPHRERPQLAVGPDTGIDSEALTQSTVASPQELADSATLAGGAGFEPGPSEMQAPPLPADPAQVWQSESSRRVSQFGLVVTLGLFGLIAATVAFVQFARSWSSSAEPPLAAADTNAPADDSPGPTVARKRQQPAHRQVQSSAERRKPSLRQPPIRQRSRKRPTARMAKRSRSMLRTGPVLTGPAQPIRLLRRRLRPLLSRPLPSTRRWY